MNPLFGFLEIGSSITFLNTTYWEEILRTRNFIKAFCKQGVFETLNNILQHATRDS